MVLFRWILMIEIVDLSTLYCLSISIDIISKVNQQLINGLVENLIHFLTYLIEITICTWKSYFLPIWSFVLIMIRSSISPGTIP
jgi:hypothetical protein